MIGTFIDIETTGFLAYDKDEKGIAKLRDDREILEVGFLIADMATKKILNHGVLYFYKPYFQIENDAQAIHGLTRPFLKNYEQDFEKNLIILNSIIQNTCIVGKNSTNFDIPFIKAFLEKHIGPMYDIGHMVFKENMKTYGEAPFLYDPNITSLDMQILYHDKYRDRYYDKYQRMPAPNKKGKLEEYIELIPGGLEATQHVYNSLTKDRETGAHGALYDTVMTYIVWCDAKNNKLC